MATRVDPDIQIYTNLKVKTLKAGNLTLATTNTVSLNFGGSFTANGRTVRYTIIGNICILNINAVSGTSTIVGQTNSTTAIPVEARPASNVIQLVPGMLANGIEGTGYISVLTTGIIRLSFNTTAGNFPASGTSGFLNPVTVVYYLGVV